MEWPASYSRKRTAISTRVLRARRASFEKIRPEICETVSWGVDISSRPQTSDQLSCEDLTFAFTDATCLIGQSSAGSGWEVVTISDNGDGYLLFTDNTKRWLNSSCMSSIASAGITIAGGQWDRVKDRIDSSESVTCQNIISTLSSVSSGECTLNLPGPTQDPTPSESTWQAVTVSDRGDGYLIFGDGTKRWINEICVSQLQSRGVSLSRVLWSEVGSLGDSPRNVSCEEIANAVR